MGGEPGSRLARRLAMPVSGDTLLRMIRAAGGEPAAPVRVLGVDDWAWRKGQRYGTILCDLERRRVVDLLPDRSADGLARWLQDHPGVEVAARDRGGAYADGAGRGAPGAEHVADRWHLLENCGQAVLDALRGRQWCLRRAAQGGRVAAAPDAEPPPMTAAERRQWEGWRRRRRTHETAMELHRRGVPIKEIARATGIARNTARRWVRGRSPEPSRPRRSVLALHAGFLEQRWQEGCRNGAQLWRELRAQGADVGLRVVGEWATRRRLAGRGGRLASNLAGSSAREAARLLMRDDADLSRAEAAYLRRLLDLAPEIARVRDLARRFAAMVKQRQADALEAWLEDAEDSPLAALANGLRQDLAAVRAALTSAWSSGQVEGQITRLKLIKRSMYGRAKLDLLRQRVMRRA
jgi:transposase